MSLKRSLTSFVLRLLASRSLYDIRWRWREMNRVLSGRAHELHYFHQVDDPYSHLMVQLLPQLRLSYDVKIHTHLVAPPDDDAAPERKALEGFSRRDAADIAPFHGLEFPDTGKQPSRKSYILALRALTASSNFINTAFQINKNYWADNSGALEKIAMVSEAKVNETLEEGTTLRRELGHYLGGTLFYNGEWYWGVDRLPYLEERLDKLRLRHVGCKQVCHFQTRPNFMSRPSRRKQLKVEFFPSMRSPYSYLAMEEVLDLPNHYPVNVIVRPVLPMVMRGLPVPQNKGRYIIQDAAREAERVNVPFGNIYDPVGRPVLRGLSLFSFADSKNKGGAFLLAFCQLAWAEGTNMGSDNGLCKAILRIGLDWEEAQNHLDKPGWEKAIEANRQELMAAGLWGVPCFRLLDENDKPIFQSWGRDRIWLLADKIQKALES